MHFICDCGCLVSVVTSTKQRRRRHQNEDKPRVVRSRSVSGTEAIESIKEAANGQFGLDTSYFFGVEIMNCCVRVLFVCVRLCLKQNATHCISLY